MSSIKQSNCCHCIDWIAKLGTMTLNRMNYSKNRLQNGLNLTNTSLDDGNVDDLDMSQIFKKFVETSNGKIKVNKNATCLKKTVTYKMDPDSHYRVYIVFKNDILVPQSGENKNNHNRRQSEIANEWCWGIVDWNYMFENYNLKWNEFPVLIGISNHIMKLNESIMNLAIKKNRIQKQCEKGMPRKFMYVQREKQNTIAYGNTKRSDYIAIKFKYVSVGDSKRTVQSWK